MGKRRIDWAELHRRQAAAAAALEGGWTPAPEETERILQERAKALAREEQKPSTEEAIEVVEFLLAQERYGIESAFIREVYPLREYTPLPGVPAFILGLLNVRGRILSVIDIRKFFALPEKGISDLNKVIIISSESMEFGILADAILGVRHIAKSELSRPLPALSGIGRDFIRGVADEYLVILDAFRILTDPSVVVYEEV